MAHPDASQHHLELRTDSLSQSALQRYLPADRVATLLSDDCPPRLQREAFAQLASARYAISTYLPRHLVARQIATSDTDPWIEWVEGTLLFADVSGSTALAERLTALGREGTEVVTRILNGFFDAMIQVIDAAGGDLLTFGGDALLILFRGPQHAHIATNTALELLRICDSDTAGHSLAQPTIPGIGTFTLSMHIGVESGRVALASAGSPGALRYSALGNTINRVARAEGYGGKGELVVGPNTWTQIAIDAEGMPVAEGYVRVTALRVGALPSAVLPDDEPITIPPEQALPLIVQQLDRISAYLPAGLLNRILIDPQRAVIEADLRPVTVLFAQISGIGQIVETLPPAQAAGLLDAGFRAMQTAIQSFGGVINKFDLAEEGDKLLAIFGAPVAYEDHAERAARAALAMQQTFASLAPSASVGHASESLVSNPIALISLRIGLNTGNVFAGNIGTASRKEYTVMGDAVNVAARVMSRSAWGEVWCSAATATQIATRLVCEDQGFTAVKGKSEPLHLLRVARERDQTPRLQTESIPLIGRQDELGWLQAHLSAAQAGHGRVVRVSGAAGVGKSRLVNALLDQAHEAGMQVVHAHCLSYAINIPYAPWSEWLKCLCGIEAGDPPLVREEKVTAHLARLGTQVLVWLPLLADLARLVEVEETSLTRALNPQQRQTRRFELIADLIRAVSMDDEPAGLLLLFEDLHWADQVSLDLWRYVAAHIADVPVLMVGAHRPQLDWSDTAPGGDGAYVLTLDELSPAESELLLTTHMGDLKLPQILREQLVVRAGGNPLFLEELLRAVIDDSTHPTVKQSQPEAMTTTPALDELPDSLQGLMLSRIDRLDEPSRAILRVAAVIGQRFPFGVLQSIHPSGQQALIAHLDTLDTEEITQREREIPDRIDIFRHALMQEVAYQSLLYARRRELHRRIGEYLEYQHADDLQPHYDLLAHHYRLSDHQAKAVTYLLLAGHAAREVYANDEAIQYYRWAIAALQTQADDAQTWEARQALGDVLCTVGRYDEAIAEYSAILAADHVRAVAAETFLPLDVAAEALRSRSIALERQGQYTAALAELRQAETLVRTNDHPSPLLLSAIYSDIGAVLMRLSEYDQALEVCLQGLGKLRHDQRTHEDERIEARLHTHLGTIYGMRGDYSQARFHFEHALAAQEAMEKLYDISILHNNIGYLWQLQSEYEQAIVHYSQAEELARKMSAKFVLSGTQINKAYAYYCQGAYDQAEDGCYAALQLCQEMNERDGTAKIYDTLGEIAYNRGAYAQALTHYEQAQTIHRELGSSYQEGNTLTNIARVYSTQGELAQAETLAQQAHTIAEQLQAPQLLIEALNVLAEVDLLTADRTASDEAAVLLDRSAERSERAATLAEELGSKFDQGVAQRLLGQVATRQDQPFDVYFQRSMVLFTEIKNRFELAYTQVRYAEALTKCDTEQATMYRKQAKQTFNAIGAHGELGRLGDLERSL